MTFPLLLGEFDFAPLAPTCPLPSIAMTEIIFYDLSPFSSIAKFLESEDGAAESPDPIPPREVSESDAEIGRAVYQLLFEGRLEATLEEVQRIQDLASRAETTSRVVLAYLDRGEFQQAETIALSIPVDPSIKAGEEAGNGSGFDRDWAISVVYNAYVRKGDLDSALALLNRWNPQFRASRFIALLRDLAKAYQEQGQMEQAIALVDRALTVYRTRVANGDLSYGSPDGSPEPVALARFFILSQFRDIYSAAQLAAQSQEKAIALAPEMLAMAQIPTEPGMAVLSSLLDAADLYRQNNQREPAHQILTFVIDRVNTLREPYLKAILLASAANQYALWGETDRAQQLLSQGRNFDRTVSEPTQQNLSRISLVQVYSGLGLYEEADRVAETIESPDLRQQVQEAITCAEANPFRS